MRVRCSLLLALIACDASLQPERDSQASEGGEVAAAEVPADDANSAEAATTDEQIAEALGSTENGRPTHPSRQDVANALIPISRVVATECSTGSPGAASARIIFGSGGNVLRVNVTGLAPTANECIARRVREARVPPFTRPEFSVNFPFRVQ